MQIKQYCWRQDGGWDCDPIVAKSDKVDVMFVFGCTAVVTGTNCIKHLHQVFPEARMIGCTTAGEICGTIVSDNQLVVTTVQFAKATVRGAAVYTPDYGGSEEATKALLEQFPRKGLVHIFLLSDGLLTNGSDIVRGIQESLPYGFPVTGGLAADSLDFNETYVIADGKVERSTIAAIGFYGESLKIGCGSAGGWIPFGPERLITRSKGNILKELDGLSALELYRQYLGNPPANLPAAGIRFPLSIQLEEGEEPMVRTMVLIDEKNDSIVFAGDVPTGCYARFMRAMPDDLIDGAAQAARISKKDGGEKPELCILITCTGRRAVLKQLTEEETESVEEAYEKPPVMTGFYSYGEIAPFGSGNRVILHNQTMTITTISEE